MIIRFEEIKNSTVSLIIDELGNYLGKMYTDEIIECLLDGMEPLEEEEYTFWHVNKLTLDAKLRVGTLKTDTQ